MTRKQFVVPEATWVPLRQAVFAFRIGDDGSCALADDASLHEMEKLLAIKSGADTSEIDPSKSVFRFSYFNRGSSMIFGPPWGLLDKVEPTTISIDPRLEAEALFNSEGFVSVGDEELSRIGVINRGVREATKLVWHQYLLHAFNRAVVTGAVVLYARKQSFSSAFERLPADVWPLVNVWDWYNGVAIAPDGTALWSIHADLSMKTKSSDISLKPASEATIRREIKAVYDQAQISGNKPPNIRELSSAVAPLLAAKGYHTSGKNIMKVGCEAEFMKRRRPPGRTLRSERSPK